jgi:hypothetical protein
MDAVRPFDVIGLTQQNKWELGQEVPFVFGMLLNDETGESLSVVSTATNIEFDAEPDLIKIESDQDFNIWQPTVLSHWP